MLKCGGVMLIKNLIVEKYVKIWWIMQTKNLIVEDICEILV